MIEVSSAARKTEAHSESIMIVVCNFVLDASGSSGGAFWVAGTTGWAGFSPSKLMESGEWSSTAMSRGL